MISVKRLLTIGIFMSGVTSFPGVARAHSPIEGIGTFYGYMLHTLVVPAHALLIVGVTLVLGQQRLPEARMGLTVLAVAFVAGLTISSAGWGGATKEWQLLAGALMVGSAVSIGRKLPLAAVLPAAAAAGLALGLDSAPAEAALGERPLATAGLISGTLGLALVLTGLTVGLNKHWQRIGIRVAGSWIVAVSILVLSLSLTGTTTVERDQLSPAVGAS